jgi:WD40 repeat protein
VDWWIPLLLIGLTVVVIVWLSVWLECFLTTRLPRKRGSVEWRECLIRRRPRRSRAAREGSTIYYSAGWHPNGRMLAVLSNRGVSLHDARDLTQFALLGSQFDEVSGGKIAFSPDGDLLVVYDGGEPVAMWRIADRSLLWARRPDSSWRNRLFSPDGQTLAVFGGDEDETMTLRRPSDGRLQGRLQGHEGKVHSVVFSPNGANLATGGADGTVRLWRARDGKPIRTLEGHTDAVMGVCFSPNGAMLASASTDNTVRLWRAIDGVVMQTLATASERDDVPRELRDLLSRSHLPLYHLTFSLDGSRLAAEWQGGDLRIWRVRDGSLLHRMKGSHAAFFGEDVAGRILSPDLRVIVAWHWEGGYVPGCWSSSLIAVPDPGSVPRERALSEWAGARFSHDGSLLALLYVTGKLDMISVRDSGRVRSLWPTGRSVVQMSNRRYYNTDIPSSDLARLAFSPDGSRLVTVAGSVDLRRVEDGARLGTLRP